METLTFLYLVEAVGPSLTDAFLGPEVVGVLRQEVNQLLHLGGQLDGGQVQWGGLVPVRLEKGVVGQPHSADSSRRLVHADVVAQGDDGPSGG